MFFREFVTLEGASRQDCGPGLLDSVGEYLTPEAPLRNIAR
jgi:hypothetical protein